MTPKERAAMQQALEALEELHYSSGTVVAVKKYESATAAMREALSEQPVSQEPVICTECNQPTMHEGSKCYACCQKDTRELEDALRAAAPQPVKEVELTDDEIEEVFDSVGSWKETLFGNLPVTFARAVIAADREKNK